MVFVGTVKGFSSLMAWIATEKWWHWLKVWRGLGLRELEIHFLKNFVRGFQLELFILHLFELCLPSLLCSVIHLPLRSCERGRRLAFLESVGFLVGLRNNRTVSPRRKIRFPRQKVRELSWIEFLVLGHSLCTFCEHATGFELAPDSTVAMARWQENQLKRISP